MKTENGEHDPVPGQPEGDVSEAALVEKVLRASVSSDGPSETETLQAGRTKEEGAPLDSRGDLWRPSDLLVLRQQNGTTHRIPVSKLPVVLGRGKEADVKINATSVSRRHARIVRAGMLVIIEDLNSKNGIRVNQLPVKESALRVADKIRLGDCILVVQRG